MQYATGIVIRTFCTSTRRACTSLKNEFSNKGVVPSHKGYERMTKLQERFAQNSENVQVKRGASDRFFIGLTWFLSLALACQVAYSVSPMLKKGKK